jgi:hypothetical protein
MEIAQRAVRQSEHPIDRYHEQFKADTWGVRAPLELLIDFENLD